MGPEGQCEAVAGRPRVCGEEPPGMEMLWELGVSPAREMFEEEREEALSIQF